MADKIVQLTDKDGNNIYPLAASAGGGGFSMEEITVTQSSVSGDAVEFTLDKNITDYDALWLNGNIQAKEPGAASGSSNYVILSGSISQLILPEGTGTWKWPRVSNAFSETQRFTKSRDCVVSVSALYNTILRVGMSVSSTNNGVTMSGEVYRDWSSYTEATGGSFTMYGIKLS